ncbi:MAG: hypothetical protein QOI86_3904, partial [Actinomycetota bacterium]|nr:hypothetical protein [Actinomycetota bacterium]
HPMTRQPMTRQPMTRQPMTRQPMTRQPTPGASPLAPWTGADVTVTAVAAAVGVAALLVSWAGSSTATALGQQTTWIGVGIGALLAASAAASYWLLQGRRAVVRRRADWVVREAASAGVREQLVSLASMTRFHRGECPLVAGKPVVAANRAAHEREGRRPCGVCRP